MGCRVPLFAPARLGPVFVGAGRQPESAGGGGGVLALCSTLGDLRLGGGGLSDVRLSKLACCFD
ncbi:hypothetical protein WG66_005841 [Moniliophthora roreri]|nr:hypothetical protein WG66_005841 [Moniliophthora roreri]